MTSPLDANVLIALVVTDHVHQDAAGGWVAGGEGAVATRSVTQGALVRFLLRAGAAAATAQTVLRGLDASSRHEFWPDDVPYERVELLGVVGHRQAPDAYLAASARARGQRLVTSDRALVALHDDVTELLTPRVRGALRRDGWLLPASASRRSTPGKSSCS